MKNNLFEASDFDTGLRAGPPVIDINEAASIANTLLTERDKVRDAELQQRLEEQLGLSNPSTRPNNECYPGTLWEGLRRILTQDR